MQRWSILVVALLIGAAAPVRAFCEAACLAPAHEPASHCPSHESSSDAPAMAATSTADCPVLDAARPIQAKLDFAAAPSAPLHLRTPAPSHLRTLAPPPPRSLAPSHPGKIPLRI